MSIPLLILATILIVSVQSHIYKHWGLKGVEYARFFNLTHVFAGENVQLIEVISNKKLLPVLWLRLESRIDPSLRFQRQSNLDIKHHQYHKSFFSLMPYTKITRRHNVNCTRRGHYTLKSAILTCNDAFNMIQLNEELTLSACITVYPKILPVNELYIPSHSWQGDIVVRRWIQSDPFMISGVREYRYGDPMNRINWKSTARTGNLQVYNTDYTTNIRLMILLNIDSDEFMWDTADTDIDLIERGISYCASVADYAISHGIETGFGCNGCIFGSPGQPIFVPSRCSSEHMSVLLDSMARLVIKKAVFFHTFFDETASKNIKNTDFLVVTPFISEHIEAAAKRLREAGNSVELLKME